MPQTARNPLKSIIEPLGMRAAFPVTEAHPRAGGVIAPMSTAATLLYLTLLLFGFVFVVRRLPERK